MNNRNYWCYRIDNSAIEFFRDELIDKENLRQGWGYHPGQDLNKLDYDMGARGNLAIKNKVKKGDILLVPRLPDWGRVAIVEATADWDTAYRFEIDKEQEDYGHIFPAKFLKSFSRANKNVPGGIRSTLRNPSRFWNINYYSGDVDKLIEFEEIELVTEQEHQSRFENAIGSVFNEVFKAKDFSRKLYEKFTQQFNSAEWEFALMYGLQKLFPFYKVDRVGGINEKEHGTDILIKMPGLSTAYEYAIAIQVKDHWGNISSDVISQIDKATSGWEKENLKIIDKIVIVTQAKQIDNKHVIENSKGVKFLFSDDVQQLITEIGKSFIGIKKLV